MERSPYSIYANDELRECVVEWANTSSWSQADIWDTALEDFFARYTITDAGTIVEKSHEDATSSTESTQGDDSKLDRVLKNQERILAQLDETTRSEGKPSTHTQVEPAEAVDEIENHELGAVESKLLDLERDYHHDIELAPERVESALADSEHLTHTKRHLLPAFVAAANYRLADDEDIDWEEPVSWNEIKGMMQRVLDVSQSGAYNYRDSLVNQGVMMPSLSEWTDDAVMRDVARGLYAAVNDKQKVDVVWESVSDQTQQQYERSLGYFVSKVLGDTAWEQAGYYFGAESWTEASASLVDELAVTMQTQTWSNPQGIADDGDLGAWDRARGARQVMLAWGDAFDEYGTIDSQLVANVAAMTFGDDEAFFEQLAALRAAFWDADDEAMSESDARTVLGVAEDAGADEVREAYEKYVLNHHPDVSEEENEEFDEDEYHRVIQAKDVLLG